MLEPDNSRQNQRMENKDDEPSISIKRMKRCDENTTSGRAKGSAQTLGYDTCVGKASFGQSTGDGAEEM